MKKIIIALLVMLSGITLSGQEKQTNSNPSNTKDYYLQKAKKQNTTAWVLLGGGTALVVGGAIIFGENFDLFSDEKNSGDGAGIAMVVVGGLAMVGSIPFFIQSSSNKRKAQTAPVTFNFKLEKGIDIRRQWKQFYFPALSIKLNLR